MREIVTPEAHADDTTVPFHLLPTLRVRARVCRAHFRAAHVRIYARLLELRIRALCSSSGKTSVGRQWEELSNADICSNVPRAASERRGGYSRVPFKVSMLRLYRKNREIFKNFLLSKHVFFYIFFNMSFL